MREKVVHGGWGFYLIWFLLFCYVGFCSSVLVVFSFLKNLRNFFNEFWIVSVRAHTFIV